MHFRDEADDTVNHESTQSMKATKTRFVNFVPFVNFVVTVAAFFQGRRDYDARRGMTEASPGADREPRGRLRSRAQRHYGVQDAADGDVFCAGSALPGGTVWFVLTNVFLPRIELAPTCAPEQMTLPWPMRVALPIATLSRIVTFFSITAEAPIVDPAPIVLPWPMVVEFPMVTSAASAAPWLTVTELPIDAPSPIDAAL